MPKSKPHARRGADAAFAKAMARSEFGRFYCTEADLQEVRRSLARASQSCELSRPSKPDAVSRPERSKPAPKRNASPPWRPVGVRERRAELEVGLKRLKEARKAPSSRKVSPPTGKS